MASWDDLDIENIWVFVAFPISMVSIESKKPNLPFPSAGQKFLCTFINMTCQNVKILRKDIEKRSKHIKVYACLKDNFM